MRSERVLKTFSALSFSENAIAGTGLPAPTQTEHSRREGTLIVRRPETRSADSLVLADRALRDAVERSRKFREMLRRRAMTLYRPTVPYYYLKINK